MFNFFSKDYKMPDIPKSEVKTPAYTFYSIGPSSDGRVSFRTGNIEFTLNESGIDSMIASLKASKSYLNDANRLSGKQPEDGCQEEYDPL